MSTALLEPADRAWVRAVSWRVRSAIATDTIRLARVAPATLCVVASIVAVWFLERALSGQVHGGRTIGYIAFGGLPNAAIAGRGDPSQLWRWVSSGLVHDRSNPLHLVSNSLALIVVGSVIERLYGRLVVLSVLAVGVAAGSFTWLTVSALGLAAEPDYTIGLSAGVCALVGIMLVYGYRERHHLSHARAQAMKAQAALGIGLMLLIGLVVPNLNNVAHAGGFVAGALIAFCLPTTQDGRTLILGWRTRAVFSIVLVASVVSAIFAAHNLIGRLLLPA
jgi:membrane associated rhomboid family serine protease